RRRIDVRVSRAGVQHLGAATRNVCSFSPTWLAPPRPGPAPRPDGQNRTDDEPLLPCTTPRTAREPGGDVAPGLSLRRTRRPAARRPRPPAGVALPAVLAHGA